MIDIGSHPGHKIGILLVLATLTIGNVAGLSWVSPEDGSEHNQTVNLSVDASNVDGTIENVTVYAELPEDDSFESVSEANQDGDIYYYEYDAGSSPYGSYQFRLVAYNSTDQLSETDPRTFTLDGEPPSIIFEGSDYVQDDPTISVDIGDEYTGVDDISASADNDAEVTDISDTSCDDKETCTIEFDIDTGDLDSGDSFDLEITATDDVGNEDTISQSFTFDNSYDAGTSPEFDPSGGHVFILEDDGDDKTVDVTIDGSDDENAEVRMTCYDEEGDEIDQTDYKDVSDSDESYTFSCEISADEDDYGASAVDMQVEFCDEAGNCVGEDDINARTYHMDLNPPTVSGLEIPSNAELYNANFDVEFTAFDSASDIEEVEYYFDSDTNYGDGTDFDYSMDTDRYEVDISDLDAGDHTLYVRARDEADRWSSVRTVDFSFDPDAVPEIALDVPENMSVTAGEQGSFDVTVENTGELHISSIEVSGSAEEVFSDSQSISDLEPGESITATLDVDTEANNIGEHTIEISTDNPSMTEEIDLIVEANAEQQDQIDSDLSDYQSMLQEMEANVTSLKQKVSEDKRQRLESNFSTFKQKIEDAQSAVDNGDYYEAEAILEGIDQDRAAAENTYEAVQKEYQNNQFWMLIFLGLGGVVVLGGGVIGALSYTDEVDFDIRDYIEDLQEIEFESGLLEKHVKKIKKMMDGKDTSEAEDFEWDGFNN